MNPQTMKQQTECIAKAAYPDYFPEEIRKVLYDGCRHTYKYKQVSA